MQKSPRRAPRHAYFIITCLCALVTGGCATQREVGTAPRPLPAFDAEETLARTPGLRYELSEPAFRLISNTPVGAALAVPTLGKSADAFASIFGRGAEQIAVVVEDSARPRLRAVARSGSMPERTIALIGSGLEAAAGDGSHTRHSFQTTLRVQAASAWVGAYTSELTNLIIGERLATERVRTRRESGEVSLPDWLHVATLRLVADTNAARAAQSEMEARFNEAMPLRALFAYMVPESADAELEELIGDAGGTPAGGSETSLFVAQATSVTAFLRQTRGSDVVPALMVPLLAGRDIAEVLAGAHVHTTMDELEASWRSWVQARHAGVVATAEQPAP